MSPKNLEEVEEMCAGIVQLGLHAQNHFMVEQVVFIAPFLNLQFYSRTDDEVADRLRECDTVMTELVQDIVGMHNCGDPSCQIAGRVRVYCRATRRLFPAAVTQQIRRFEY